MTACVPADSVAMSEEVRAEMVASVREVYIAAGDLVRGGDALRVLDL